VISVEGDEAALLAMKVRELHESGIDLGEIAVLFRTNSQAEGFARVLRARGLPAAVRRSESEETGIDAVTVASLHAAKGLEWDHVLIGGAIEGLLPISYATDDAAIAEERRLFYVGVTRARQTLVVTYEGQRSRFLDQVLPVASTTRTPAPVPAKTATIASCRLCGRPLGSAAARKRGRCDDCPGAADPQVYQRLTEWRTAVAAREAMPEFVVATDATLAALAEVLPTTESGLREVVGPRKAQQYGAELLALLATERI
jgi:DNA helicase-2/ATP-dependent DNA helicase PcrA